MLRTTLEVVTFDGTTLAVGVELVETDLAQIVLKALGTPPREITQARWSGHGLCVDLTEAPLPVVSQTETALSGFDCGTIAVHLGEPKELVIAYGPVQYFVPPDNEPCHFIGDVERTSLEKLVKIGDAIWRSGVGQMRLLNLPYHNPS